jgi:hypothetical protein
MNQNYSKNETHSTLTKMGSNHKSLINNVEHTLILSHNVDFWFNDHDLSEFERRLLKNFQESEPWEG